MPREFQGGLLFAKSGEAEITVKDPTRKSAIGAPAEARRFAFRERWATTERFEGCLTRRFCFQAQPFGLGERLPSYGAYSGAKAV